MMIMAKASPQSLRKARGGPPKNRHREAILTQLTQPLSSHARPLTRTRTTYRYLMFCLSSSAGSIGTSLASQSSHLNNAFFFCLRARIFYFAIFLEEPSFSHSFLDVRAYCRESTASTAQRTCRSYRGNASEQTELAKAESQYVGEHLYSSLCSLNERRNQNLPGVQKAYNHSQSSFSRCDA